LSIKYGQTQVPPKKASPDEVHTLSSVLYEKTYYSIKEEK